MKVTQMKPVTQQEITDALNGIFPLDGYGIDFIAKKRQKELAERIKQHGIAPPDGYVLVPVKDLRTIEHRLLNAERVFKRDVVNHKFMGFDLISSSIDMVATMLSVVKEK